MTAAAAGQSQLARRLAELAERYGLDSGAVERLAALLDHLASAPWAPTTVTESSRTVDVHVADSLVALERPELAPGAVAADLGSGAGYPALALAACRPDLDVRAVESNRRKAGFIAESADAAGVANVTVIAERIESWSGGAGVCDVVTARALAPLPVVAEYAAPLLRQGGHLIAWKGRPSPEEERAGTVAAEELGLRPVSPTPVDPFPAAGSRRLYVWPKIAATPERFPRRPGMARKRPLGTAPAGRAG